jgi:hypothetical protein
MILRANIVMLHYTRGVEVGDERSARLVRFICGVTYRIVQDIVREVLVGIKIFVDGVDLFNESTALLIGVTEALKPSQRDCCLLR